ncbi:MAG: DUF2946 family protein [Betaproteobacteria bacterium]
MFRCLKIVVVLLLIALVPARAIGSVTISICADGQQSTGAHESAPSMTDHSGHASHDGQDAPSTEDSGHKGCGYCAAHCAGTAAAVPADIARFTPVAGAERIPFGVRAAPGVCPIQLDRPPLVS